MPAKNTAIKVFLKAYEEARNKKNHDELFDFVLLKLIEIFDADIAIHFHIEKNSIIIENERYRNKTIPKLKKKEFSHTIAKKIFPCKFDKVCTINNLDKILKNQACKDFWLSSNIKSLVIYSPGSVELSRKDINITGGSLLGYSKPSNLTIKETELFQIILDSVNTIFSGIKDRQNTEEERRNYIATLTHDLRTPIVSTQKIIEYILSKKPDTPLQDYSELLNGIQEVNEELLLLINNLLNLYHIESGKFNLNYEKFNITNMINESIAMLKHIADENMSTIKFKNINDIFFVEASKEDIKRVIINLLANAIKHNEAKTHIEISIQKKQENIIICISDNGKGIKESQKETIFEKYISDEGKIGAGLGLYLSKQIVEAHNGSIWLESQEGVSSKFYFKLPIKNQS